MSVKNAQPIARPDAATERMNQLKKIASLSTLLYVIPLYLLFAFADSYYYPLFFKSFLSVRLAAVATIGLQGWLIRRAKTLASTQRRVTVLIMLCCFPLHTMLYTIPDPGTPIYAALMLAVIGIASAFRFLFGFYFLNLAIAIVPAVIAGFLKLEEADSSYYWLNSFFLLSAALICTISRHFNEELYNKELATRSQLADELTSREAIIDQKTKESVNLRYLSRQFSPQVVAAFDQGILNIDRPVHRSEICAVFVDIVGSTERLAKLDRDDANKILSMFIDDAMGTFLKYDITIDKFLGDGILAFSNDPMKHPDFVERALKASEEVMQKIAARQEQYDSLWLTHFRVRMGISSGFASVGFYGTENHFRSYTAIGRCVNLASRLTTAAEPGEIIVSHDVLAKIRENEVKSLWKFDFTEMGYRKLKGFESDDIKIYRFNPAAGTSGSEACPNGHSDVFLNANEKGSQYFRCRVCGTAFLGRGSTKQTVA